METILLFAPLIGALLCGFGWRIFGETASQVIATAMLFLACLLSWIIFLSFDPSAHPGGAYVVDLFTWISERARSIQAGPSASTG